MRVELYEVDGIQGEIKLEGEINLVDGVAVGSNRYAKETMKEMKIVEPGPKLVTPADGERYLRAFPLNLSGTYAWAKLVED